MLSDVADALRTYPALAHIRLDDLEPMPGKGTAHGHVRLRPRVEGRELLARIPYALPGDADAARRLRVQANAFRHATLSGAAPRLYAAIAPTEALPGGMLVVDAIEGRAPALPEDMAAIADALAALHAVPLAPEHGDDALPRAPDSFGDRLALVEETLDRYLERGRLEPGTVTEIAQERAALRGLAAAQDSLVLPQGFLLTDTHPGNFLVDAKGKAWFVDLEKAMIGGARACDLAHASLYTSTRWDPDVDAVLSADATRAFYRRYLDHQPEPARAALLPALLAARRLIWLRTTSFCIRWKVETATAPAAAGPRPWSDSGLDARMREHLAIVLADILSADTIRRIRGEWLEDRLSL
jgi:hypothetical protein